MTRKSAAAVMAVGLLVLAVPGEAVAQEIALTAGRFLGDDVLDDLPVIAGPDSIGFGDGTLFGLRFSMGAALVDLEATLATAGSNLLGGTDAEFGARFTYAEAGAALKIFPGPVAPFLAAGIGYHRIGFDIDGADSYGRLGYYAGVGLKVKLGGVGIRGDVRDHITPINVDSLDPLVAETLGLTEDRTVHNFELSVGLVISF